MSIGGSRISKVSVLVLSWNGLKHLQICLPAIEAQQLPGRDFEILLLDNGSHDGTVAWVERHHPRVRLLASQNNLGFCAGNNRLAEEAGGEAVVLLNNDTRPREGWLAALVGALEAAPPDVAAVSGQIVDWQGERLDFARGMMTFDGHAFQLGYRRPLAGVELPAAGSELLFACGGNMIVRRSSFLAAGAFDADYFAYLEDVDLGWRLWAGGERVIFEPSATVHHRSMATSQVLGNENRGFLFERNALLTAYKNFDDDYWPRLLPLVLLTLIHRTQTLLVQNNPGGGLITLDPYAGLIANTAWPAALAAAAAAASGSPPPNLPKTSLAEKWRGYGPRELFKRGVRKALRGLLPRFVFEDPAAAMPRVTDPRTLAQLRVLSWTIGHLEETAAKRRGLQARRQRSDAEIFERFPLAVVPTYPGDEKLFAGEAFAAAWPAGVPRVDRTLEELMDMS
jgi:GT2 family glycosyltransferase